MKKPSVSTNDISWAIIVAALCKGPVSRYRIRDITGLDYTTVCRRINILKAKGCIKLVGKGFDSLGRSSSDLYALVVNGRDVGLGADSANDEVCAVNCETRFAKGRNPWLEAGEDVDHDKKYAPGRHGKTRGTRGAKASSPKGQRKATA